MSDTELWARRLERQRHARKEANPLLESTNRELSRAHAALRRSREVIGAANTYRKNLPHSLMNALIVVAPDGYTRPSTLRFAPCWGIAKRNLWMATAILLPAVVRKPPATATVHERAGV